jgi:hypothetical protein
MGNTDTSSFWSRVLARALAFVSLLGVVYASITRKRRSDRHSAPPSH